MLYISKTTKDMDTKFSGYLFHTYTYIVKKKIIEKIVMREWSINIKILIAWRNWCIVETLVLTHMWDTFSFDKNNNKQTKQENKNKTKHKKTMPYKKWSLDIHSYEHWHVHSLVLCGKTQDKAICCYFLFHKS